MAKYHQHTNGLKFELYVAALYRDLDKSHVRHNVVCDVSSKDRVIKVQFDVVYASWFFDHYVECKYHHPQQGQKVSLDEMAKFASQLDLMNVPGRRGEMVTNSFFSDRALEYAESRGIVTYDKDALKRMEQQRQSLLSRLMGFSAQDVEKAIRSTSISGYV